MASKEASPPEFEPRAERGWASLEHSGAKPRLVQWRGLAASSSAWILAQPAFVSAMPASNAGRISRQPLGLAASGFKAMKGLCFLSAGVS